MASIRLDHVWKIYGSRQKEVIAVRDFNLEIKDGEFVAFLGPSGCGKTSTLRMIAGLEAISKGEIYIGDQLVNYLEPSERNIAMAFETYALYPHLNVRDNISFCLKARNYHPDEIKKRVDHISDALGITEFLDQRPSELSGGQQQLISMARALVRDPQAFLLDEPLSHLDSSKRVAIRTRIKEVVTDLGATTIYVTHDQMEAIALADRIVVMNFAEVQQVGTVGELFNRPANLFTAGFVGEPAINQVPCKVRSENGSIKLVANGGSLSVELPAALGRAVSDANVENVILGIRPHNLKLDPIQEAGAQFDGSVELFEFLGEDGNLHVRVSDETSLVAVTAPDLNLKPGERVTLGVEMDYLHLFDAETGKAIRAA